MTHARSTSFFYPLFCDNFPEPQGIFDCKVVIDTDQQGTTQRSTPVSKKGHGRYHFQCTKWLNAECSLYFYGDSNGLSNQRGQKQFFCTPFSKESCFILTKALSRRYLVSAMSTIPSFIISLHS